MKYASLNKKKKEWNDEEALVNLTPLIDVVFVVLIMFILVAPMIELDNVQLAPGKEGNELSSLSTNKSLIIHVKEDNTIWVNARQIPLDRLQYLLSEMRVRQGLEEIQLFHDYRAHFGTYQSIKNSAELAGFRNLDVILKPV